MKPSDLVNLTLGGTTTACQGADEFNRLVLPDGSFTTFAVKADQVLVVTGVQALAQGFTPNRTADIPILGGAQLLSVVDILTPVDANGFVGTYQVLSPVTVKPPICLGIGGLVNPNIHLFGFLVKDK